MRFPLDELLDKRSIIQLKSERIPGVARRLEKEIHDYTKAIEQYVQEGVCTSEQAKEWHRLLYEVNGVIWNLEADIRNGKEGELGLEEVGRRAIEIRETNGRRVRIKSDIVLTVGVGYVNIKADHISAEK